MVDNFLTELGIWNVFHYISFQVHSEYEHACTAPSTKYISKGRIIIAL